MIPYIVAFFGKMRPSEEFIDMLMEMEFYN